MSEDDEKPAGETPAGGEGDVPPIEEVETAREEAAPEPIVDASETQRAEAHPARQIVAFAAGRGGAGKSLLAANVAIYLAQLGRRVVAIDADPAGGALHLLLGTQRPPRGYGDFLRKRADGLAELIVDTPVAGVGLVAGDAGPFAGSAPKQVPKAVLAAIADLAVDYVVLDLGAPDSPLCVDLWLAADVPILVTLPDPASIEATYRFAKSAFLRRLRGTRGLDKIVAGAGPAIPAPLDLYRSTVQSGGPTERLAEEVAAYRPRFIVSQTRSLADLKLGVAVSSAAQRRLGHSFEYLGHVESDEAVWVAARRRKPLVAEYPESKVAKNIEKIVRRLMAAEGERPPLLAPARIGGNPTHYEVLETQPGVSDEEIRRAFRRVREIYAEGSLAIAGLYDEHELAELHAHAHAAHDILCTPDRRRAYDLSLPEADLARAVRAAAKIGVPHPIERQETTESTLGPDEEVTGGTLRRVREAKGIELTEVAQRTKISERHLRSLEDERFSDMPAAVYVRGFVMTYARALRIDPNRAAASLLRRYHDARGGD